jgi:hypothetical protein
MKHVVLIALLAALAPAALAQSSSKGVVGVEAAGPASPVAAGSTFTGKITLAVRPGYHINAQKPTEDFLIGTNVTVTPPAGVSVVRTAYPKAQFATFSFAEEPLAVYEGTVTIEVTMKAEAAASGTLSVPAKVRFQACNDQQCLPPSTVDVSFDVALAPPDKKTQALTLVGLPPEARVAIDGRAAGRANAQGRFVASDLDVGRRRVRVETDGFEPWEQTVELRADRPETLTVALTASPEATADAPAVPAAASTEPPVASTPAAAAPAEQPVTEGSSPMPYLIGVIAMLAVGALGYFAVTRSRTR